MKIKTLENIYQEMLDSYPKYECRIFQPLAPRGFYSLVSDEPIPPFELINSTDLWMNSPLSEEGHHVIDLRPEKIPPHSEEQK